MFLSQNFLIFTQGKKINSTFHVYIYQWHNYCEIIIEEIKAS